MVAVLQAWSVEAVRAAEAAAMAELLEGELMQRASRGLAKVLHARLSGLAEMVGGDDQIHVPLNVVVLAGSGGNGGDALFASAFLANGSARRQGRDKRREVPEPRLDITAVLVAPRAHAPALDAAREAGVRVVEVFGPVDESAHASAADENAIAQVCELLEGADLVVDGVYGIGGRPDLAADGASPEVWRLVQAIGDDAYVVAVDLPSGADPEGNLPVANGVFADETVTFSLFKGVHLLSGEDASGILTLVDIGLDEPVEAPTVERLDFDDVAELWPVPGPADDKYSRGVLGVVAGGENYTGAALLSVGAAVEAGAGMVRYIGPPGATALVRAQVPEAVHGDGRVQAWLVGPGLDPHPADDDEAGQAQVRAARAALDSGLPAVVDAGGLDLLEGPRPGAGARTLLTPHAGELARLLVRLDPETDETFTAADVVRDPVAAARRAAELLHATVLLKGHRTLVVPPVASLPVRAQSNAPAWLATAGAGDVLAGIAGALLACGLDPVDAGSLAALVHGVAADDANPGGPIRARRVAEQIGPTVARLLRHSALR